MTGLMKKAICITLDTIGRMSRKRAQNVPNSKVNARQLMTQSSSPGIASNPCQPGHTSEHHEDHRDHQDIMREHQHIADSRRIANRKKGMRTARTMPSDSVNAPQDSATMVLRKSHSTIDRARKGR